MLRIGIIGLGTIAYIHQLAIEQNGLGELVAVSDIDSATHKDYDHLPFYNNYIDMLEKENLDVVHICLPHDLHVPIAKKCIEYGVHVFLEKPLALTYQEGKELAQVVSDNNSKLAICFQNRYNNTTKKLLEIFEEKSIEEIGQLKAVKGLVTWFRPESYYKEQPWRGELKRAGGGTITNQSIHTLDLMGLFGGAVNSCKGELLKLTDYDIEVEDTAVANYEFQNNVSGIYFATNAYVVNSSVELEVITTKKRYLIKDYKLYSFDTNDENGTLIASDDIFPGTKSYYGQGHNLSIETFYRAILDDTENYISINDALNSVLMVDLLKQSNKENKKVNIKELNYIG